MPLYLIMMLLSCSTMTSNGNGITPPTSQREVWATSAVIIVGQLLFVVLTGALTCDATCRWLILWSAGVLPLQNPNYQHDAHPDVAGIVIIIIQANKFSTQPARSGAAPVEGTLSCCFHACSRCLTSAKDSAFASALP